MFCTACGTSNPENALFCSRCGKRIREAALPQAAGVPQAPPVANPTPANMPAAAAPPITPAPVSLPPRSSGTSWIDVAAPRPKVSESWIQPGAPPTPPAVAPPAAAIPPATPVPATPPPAAPLPAVLAPRSSGTSWIDPAAKAPPAPRPADSWIRLGPPAAPPVQAPVPVPPAMQSYAPPAQPVYIPPQYAQPYPPAAFPVAAVPAKELKGNGGWLLLLTLTLVMLGPLGELFLMVMGLVFVGQINRDGFTYYFMVDSVVRILVSIVSAVIGVKLWNQRPRSVLWAKRFLLFVLTPCGIIGGILPSMYPPADMQGTVPQLEAFIAVCTVGAALAGLAYLKNSKRVAATYPGG